jgi:hypothetical protein
VGPKANQNELGMGTGFSNADEDGPGFLMPEGRPGWLSWFIHKNLFSPHEPQAISQNHEAGQFVEQVETDPTDQHGLSQRVT